MKISIVTPSFNSAAFIEHTIQSIYNQSYQEFEHIVVDGGSTDGTVEILRRYPHLRWISEKDRGQSDAINKGFKMATGDILAWQNADDLYFPNTFEVVIDFFHENPHVDIVYGDYQVIDADGQLICEVNPIDWKQWLFAHGRFVPLQPTVFWRREVYQTVGELDENLHYCMDVDFFARTTKKFTFAKIPAVLGKFRIHHQSKTHNSANHRKIYLEHKRVLSKHFKYTMLDGLLFDMFYYRGRLAEKYLVDVVPHLMAILPLRKLRKVI